MESPAQMMAARISGTMLMLVFALSLALMGCERREKVLEIKTPGGSIEVDKKTDLINGDKSIEVENNRN
ncbi:hypothetical protein [Planctomicrobium piriforme]|nr:hypothetical protein [Planctomicrobium piriforme]